MGKALLPPGSLSVPALARAMGLQPSTLYHHIAHGRGPRLRPVTPAPWYRAKRQRPNSYIRIPDAVDWLLSRPDAAAYSDLCRTLRVQWIVDHIRTGQPLPQPPEVPYVSPYRRSPRYPHTYADLPPATLGRAS
jgi:hypothetical protein